MKRCLALVLAILLFLISSQPAECFFFRKKKSDFPSADFRSALLFRDKWDEGIPRIFFGMFSDEVKDEIGEKDGDHEFRGLEVETYNRTGFIYALNDYREKELIGFIFDDFSPVCGNRVAEGYARQAGWTTCSSSQGQRYLERTMRNWEGLSVEMVYWVEGEKEMLVDKDQASIWGLLPE